jgi:hypothetical protein
MKLVIFTLTFTLTNLRIACIRITRYGDAPKKVSFGEVSVFVHGSL